MCVMEVGKDAELYRNYKTPNVRESKTRSYKKFPRGTTGCAQGDGRWLTNRWSLQGGNGDGLR